MSLGDPSHDIDDTAPLPEWMQQLCALNRELPEAVQAQILAVGSASIPHLIAILEKALADDEADHGWAPSHAAKLLGMLGDAQAVPVLLRILEHYAVIDGYHRTGCEFSVTPKRLAWAKVEGNSVKRERCSQKNGGTSWQRRGRECA